MRTVKFCVVIIYFLCLVLHVLTVNAQNCVAGQYSTPVECNNGDAACEYYSWDRENHNICRPAYTVEQYNPDNEFSGEFCTVCCAMCRAGKNSCKPGTCVNCPANSISPANSTSLQACVCNAGFTGPNGGPCTACVAGTYKTTTGSVACTNCESGTGDKSCTLSWNLTNVGNTVNNVRNTVNTSNTALDVDGAISKYFETLDIDYMLSKYFKTLNVDQILLSQARGLFVCLVGGLVGAVLNSLMILVLFLWVRRLKSVMTQTDTGAA
jgi:hypothetical protein